LETHYEYFAEQQYQKLKGWAIEWRSQPWAYGLATNDSANQSQIVVMKLHRPKKNKTTIEANNDRNYNEITSIITTTFAV
jgi:hypothetical protein